MRLAECDVEIVRDRERVLDIGEAPAYRYRHAPAGTLREMVRARAGKRCPSARAIHETASRSPLV